MAMQKRIIVQPGSSFGVQCQTRGADKVEFYYQGRYLSDFQRRHDPSVAHEKGSHSFNVTNAQYRHAGTAICFAHNAAGTASATTTIVVWGKSDVICAYIYHNTYGLKTPYIAAIRYHPNATCCEIKSLPAQKKSASKFLNHPLRVS